MGRDDSQMMMGASREEGDHCPAQGWARGAGERF
jgi:hypothetical protein